MVRAPRFLAGQGAKILPAAVRPNNRGGMVLVKVVFVGETIWLLTSNLHHTQKPIPD